MPIHPNTPPKLVKIFKRAGSYHKTADEIEVNVSYVYELITKGKEPNDTTPALREIRHRLGLRKYKPRNRPKPPPVPEHIRWWRRVGKPVRDTIIEKLYHKRQP